MIKECIICGKKFETNTRAIICSPECRALRKKGCQRCPVCGKIFSVRKVNWGNGEHKIKKMKYCSKQCRQKFLQEKRIKKNKERYSNDEEYRKKIKNAQRKYNKSEKGKNILQANKLKRDKRIKDKNNLDNINLKELYNRDNGVCWICGKLCDYNDKEYRVSEKGHRYLATGPNYPSVDHVIPLSKGGAHTWNNVKLAHKRCNSKKCDKILFTAELL